MGPFNQPDPSPRERATLAGRLANVAAPPLILLLPLVGFLHFHHYELWRPESVLSALPLIGLGLMISGFIALRPTLLRPAVTGLLLVVFLDFQFQSNLWIDQLLGWEVALGIKGAVAVGGALIIVLTLMSICWLLRRHLGIIVTTVFGVMVLTTVLLPPENILNDVTYSRDGAAKADLPPVLHVVLDGQIGLEGLPGDIPGGADLRRDLKAFYERFGFTVFGRAFTHYNSTYESLSNLMNRQSAARSGANIATLKKVMPRRGIRLQENAWFRALSDRGYRIRIYQTDYLDFCSPDATNVDYCFVAPSNSIVSVMDAGLSLGTKVEIILNTYLQGSFIYRHLVEAGMSAAARYGHRSRPAWLWRHGLRLGAISAASVIERLTGDVRAAPHGTAFFMHLLIPHGAYVFGPDCRLRPDIHTWLGPDAGAVSGQLRNTPTSRQVRYGLYFDQVRCAHRKLAALFEQMETAGVLDKATVIVHGDHGSQITLGSIFQPPYSESDLIDSYSTLFAIRIPGGAAGYDRRMRSIQGLFADIVLNRPFPTESVEIFTDAAGIVGSRYTRRPMPEFENRGDAR